MNTNVLKVGVVQDSASKTRSTSQWNQPIARACVATMLLAVPLFSFAQAQNLLRPINEADRAAVEKKNTYFIRKETYFAKRYRLVTVDTAVLMKSEKLRIPLFDEEVVELEVKRHEFAPHGYSIVVDTEYTSPTLAVKDLISDDIDEALAEQIRPTLIGQKIYVAEVAFDEKTGLKHQYFFPDFSKHRSQAREAGHETNYDVTITISTPMLTSSYELRPLALDPRHHVLIEIDPEKQFPQERDDLGNRIENADSLENAAKREQYQRFLDDLGPDPRPSDHLEEVRQ